MIGLWFFQLPIRIIDFEGTLISFPEVLIHTLGIVSAALYFLFPKPFKILSLALCCSISVFMFFRGYDYWLHQLSFGTFTGYVSYDQPAKFEGLTREGVEISDTDLNGKIVLLDFWNTSCGICFKKFPQLQALYDQYKDDTQVIIVAVNKPLADDKPNQAFSMIEERGYTFPVVISKDENLAENFGVMTYPTTFIITDQKKITFKGDLVLAIDELKRLRSSLR